MPDPWPSPDDFVPTGKKDDDDKKQADFIAKMAQCWVDDAKARGFLEHDNDWKDVKDKKKATVDDVKAHLLKSYGNDTGAFPKLKGPRLVTAWMVARVQEYRFHNAGFPRFGNLWPSYAKAPAHARDTAEIPAEIRQKGTIKIAPGLATFLTAVNKSFGKFQASNYDGHLTVANADQGMSVDVYLKKTTSDGRWWDVAEAVKFFKAVDDTAGSADFKGTKWVSLYNHFDVASQVNKSSKLGGIRLRATGNVYHGPDPMKLHIHLEVVVPTDKDAP